MICGLEIGLAIFGILALVRGKMTLTKNKIVVGVPARLLGLIALAPFPVIFLIILVLTSANGDEQFAQKNQGMFAGIEIGTVILTAILVFAIGAMVAVSPEEARRRERGDRYEEDEDEDDRDDRRDRRGRDRDRDDDHDDRDDRRDRDAKPWNR